MSITHPFGSDVKSMSEFYNKRFLRAVTLLILLIFVLVLGLVVIFMCLVRNKLD